jgi:hypothetical protein
MTNQEYKQIVKIHGVEFSYDDIPAYIRKRDKLDKMALDIESKKALEKIRIQLRNKLTLK